MEGVKCSLKTRVLNHDQTFWLNDLNVLPKTEQNSFIGLLYPSYINVEMSSKQIRLFLVSDT